MQERERESQGEGQGQDGEGEQGGVGELEREGEGKGEDKREGGKSGSLHGVPIVVILAGVSGDSASPYVQDAVHACMKR